MNKCKKAEMGIGTLIIFIAMILVAAIAAGVLLQTASSLQNKALLTGERSKGQVSTTFIPLLLFAEDGEDQNVEYFYLKMKLAPGADPIKMEDTYIEFDLVNGSAELNYVSGNCTDSSATGFNTNPSTSIGNYTILYMIESADKIDGYLQRGDVIELCFEAPRSVDEEEDITIHVVPKIGTPMIVETTVPDILVDKKVFIYP